MNLGTVGAFGLSLGWARVVSAFVSERSSSVAINLLLIWAQWAFLALAGVWLGLRLSELVFGSPWRKRVLLGEPVDALLSEEGLVQGFSENRAPFFALLAACVGLSWFSVQAVSDSYLTRYNREGYFATLLRSETPAEQVTALQEVCGVLAAETRAARPVRERVAYLVVHGEGEVKRWAVWAAGQMGLRSVEGALLDALRSGDDGLRAEAALAVTRLEMMSASAALLNELPKVIASPRTARAYLQAIAKLRLPAAGKLLLPLVALMAPEVRVAAWRAIGRSGDLTLASEVWGRFESAAPLAEQCAISDALKFLGTGDQLKAMGAWFDAVPRRGQTSCPSIRLDDLPLKSGARPDSFEELEAEMVRTKMMVAIFNIAGPGTDLWLKLVSENPEEPREVRAKARDILKLLKNAPPRTERRVGTP